MEQKPIELLKPNSLTDDVVHTALLNSQSSKAFIKKMIPVVVAFIIHQRTNLSRKDFDTHIRNGVTYTVLKPEVQELYLKAVHKWLTGILDAFERNYLRELFLVFITTAKDQPTWREWYRFHFQYMGTDVISLHLLSDKEEISEATDSLLKDIARLNQYNKYKKGKFALGMYMNYYNDVTPTTYEAPFFDNDDNSAIVAMLLNNDVRRSNYPYIRSVSTTFHVVKFCGPIFSQLYIN